MSAADESYFATTPAVIYNGWAATPTNDTPAVPAAQPKPKPRRRAVLTSPGDVEVRDVAWLERGYLPAGELTILQGHGGTNKGSHSCYWAALVTNGNTDDGTSGNVIFVAAEDSLATTLKPRLIAAGADLGRIHFLSFADGGYSDALRIPDDVADLHAAVEETGARLVVIDPILTHLAAGVDSYRDHDVKRALQPLKAMAEATDCAVLAVHHLNKDTSRGALRSGQASGAFINTARVVLAMVNHDEDEDVRVLEVVKANGSRVGVRQAIRIETVDIPGLTDPVVKTTPAGFAEKGVDELLRAGTSDKGAKKRNAKELILTELAAGPQPMEHLKARGAAIDISGDTVWRAANELKGEGKARCSNSGPGTKWFWTLTAEDPALTSATVPANPHEQKTSVHTTHTEVYDFGKKSKQRTLDFLTSGFYKRTTRTQQRRNPPTPPPTNTAPTSSATPTPPPTNADKSPPSSSSTTRQKPPHEHPQTGRTAPFRCGC